MGCYQSKTERCVPNESHLKKKNSLEKAEMYTEEHPLTIIETFGKETHSDASTKSAPKEDFKSNDLWHIANELINSKQTDSG